MPTMAAAARRSPPMHSHFAVAASFYAPVHRALSEPGRLGPRYARNLPFVLGMLWREWWRRG